MPDDVFDDYDAFTRGERPRRRQFRVVGDGEKAETGPLLLRPARLPDPRTISPRQWLYGTQLLRGFVTVLVAPGGTGKTAYAMVVAAALATGIKLLNEHIFERVNVAVVNLEDPMDELDRRLAAIMIRHNLSNADLADRYFMHSGEERGIVMASLDEDGFSVVHPDEDALTKEILVHNIGLLVVDPYAESHSLEENNNPQMVKAAAAWRRVARATGCAVLLVHHVRKAAGGEKGMTIDSARGAKALTDSARVGLLMSSMQAEDAERLGISESERTQFVRLDDAKSNMAPRAERARWFKLDQVSLENGIGIYPKGDRVAAIIPWEPPKDFDHVSIVDANQVLDHIEAGLPGGHRYTDTRRGGGKRWAGRILIDLLGLSEAEATGVLKTWLKNEVLFLEDTWDQEQRRSQPGLRVNAAKRPGNAL